MMKMTMMMKMKNEEVLTTKIPSLMKTDDHGCSKKEKTDTKHQQRTKRTKNEKRRKRNEDSENEKEAAEEN